MTREDKNKLWLNTFGAVTYLEAPRVNKNLRKPYGHEASEEAVKSLIDSLRKFNKLEPKLQCVYSNRKHLTHGYRIDIFVLGYKKGFCGDENGVRQKEWEEITNEIDSLIVAKIPDAITYCEPYSDTAKFQFRWEAAVKFPQ